MEKIGLFLDRKGNKYVGRFSLDANKVEILGPICNENDLDSRQAYVGPAGSKEAAVEITKEMIKLF